MKEESGSFAFEQVAVCLVYRPRIAVIAVIAEGLRGEIWPVPLASEPPQMKSRF